MWKFETYPAENWIVHHKKEVYKMALSGYRNLQRAPTDAERS